MLNVGPKRISITSVKVNGVVLDSADYIIKEKSSFSRILFPSVESLDSDLAYPIEVEFVAGYSSIPDNIITAVKQVVLFWYENRGDVSADDKESFPAVARKLLRQYRIVNSYG